MRRDRARRDRAPAVRQPAQDEARALLGAYVDGVAELTPDERRSAEALVTCDPAARAEADAMRGVIDQLRALPPDGDEPDWSAMARAIGQAVDAAPRRPWWRRWRWWVPALTCATAAVVLVAAWPAMTRPPTAPGPAEHAPGPAAPDRTTADQAAAAESVVSLWLDGNVVEVDLAVTGELGGNFGEVDPSAWPGELAGDEETAHDDPGLLPASDLAWIDRLDETALDRAESWLAARKG